MKRETKPEDRVIAKVLLAVIAMAVIGYIAWSTYWNNADIAYLRSQGL